jgi:hypothetical protein
VNGGFHSSQTRIQLDQACLQFIAALSECSSSNTFTKSAVSECPSRAWRRRGLLGVPHARAAAPRTVRATHPAMGIVRRDSRLLRDRWRVGRSVPNQTKPPQRCSASLFGGAWREQCRCAPLRAAFPSYGSGVLTSARGRTLRCYTCLGPADRRGACVLEYPSSSPRVPSREYPASATK